MCAEDFAQTPRPEEPPREKEEVVTIGGWLLVLEPGWDAGAVRAALRNRPGVECRMDGRGTLVVVTETESASDLDEMRRLLTGAPGVRSADLVATFDDDPAASPRTAPSFLLGAGVASH